MPTQKHTKASTLPSIQLSYPIGQILEAVIELSCDGVNAGLDHAIDSHLQLLFS